MHIYASVCVAALVGSFWGTWLRKFVLREVLTSLAVVGHFSFPLFAHCCCLQVILHGLFWLIWANCTILLHLFDYSSIFDMPAVTLLYVLLTPVLVASTLV